MTSDQQAPAAAKPTERRGRAPRLAFAVMAICFAAGFVGRGLMESFVVFVLPIGASFGWDRAEVVSIYSFSVLASGCIGPFVGRLFDRAGPRIVYGIGLTLVGVSLSLAPWLGRLWQFQLLLGLPVGIASACLGNVPNATLLGRWFRERLTFATSIVFSAFGIGILAMVPVTQLLIDRFDWRGAYHILGAAALGLLVPAMLLPWRRIEAGSPDLARGAHGGGDEPRVWTIVAALREPGFWGLSAVYFFTSIAMFAITVQVVAYLVAIGFSPIQAASAWGFTGMLLPIGMLVVGWLDGVIGRRPSVLLSYGLSFIGIVFLWLLGRFPSVPLLAAFIVCFGGMLGSRGPLVSSIALKLFRGRGVATMLGAITIAAGLGSAFGSWMGGLLHDLTGSYDAVIFFAGASVLCAVLPFFTVRALAR